MKTYEEIKQIRKAVFHNALKVINVKRGNQRTHSSRICSICGRKLNRYSPVTNRYTVVIAHKICYYDTRDWFKAEVCSNAKACYKAYTERIKTNEHNK